MNKLATILLTLLVILIVSAVSATYYRLYVAQDYLILAEVDCDPEINSCFVWEDEDGEIWYYNLIEKDAADVEVCNPHREECDELACLPGDEACEAIFCNADELEEGEECAGPGLVVDD